MLQSIVLLFAPFSGVLWITYQRSTILPVLPSMNVSIPAQLLLHEAFIGNSAKPHSTFCYITLEVNTIARIHIGYRSKYLIKSHSLPSPLVGLFCI